jgi:mannose-1-phosphate guanylyltransferase
VLPEWAKEPSFALAEDRVAAGAALDALLGEWTRALTAAEVVEHLQAVRVAACQVFSADELAEDPHARHRQAFVTYEHPLAGELTMLQATWGRVAPIASRGPLVIANEEHRFVAAEQLQQVGAEPAAIILEPVGRNTAPAIAVAALEATRDGADTLLLVLPSDHVITDEAAFRAAVQAAADAAEAGKLVTFGIVPTGPETGYGYIKAADGQGVRAVERFVEKPAGFQPVRGRTKSGCSQGARALWPPVSSRR